MAQNPDKFNRFEEAIKEDVMFYETLTNTYEPYDYTKENDTPINSEELWYELADLV